MKRKADFKLQKVGGQDLLVPLGAQVMNLDGIITLNDTASCIWELLAEERSLVELTAAITERFHVPAELARDDVRAFLNEIAGLGLVEP